jgi:hypothetical protein
LYQYAVVGSIEVDHVPFPLFVRPSGLEYVTWDGIVIITCPMPAEGLLIVKFTRRLLVPEVSADWLSVAVNVAARAAAGIIKAETTIAANRTKSLFM